MDDQSTGHLFTMTMIICQLFVMISEHLLKGHLREGVTLFGEYLAQGSQPYAGPTSNS